MLVAVSCKERDTFSAVTTISSSLLVSGSTASALRAVLAKLATVAAESAASVMRAFIINLPNSVFLRPLSPVYTALPWQTITRS
jgi:hypothetical protein